MHWRIVFDFFEVQVSGRGKIALCSDGLEQCYWLHWNLWSGDQEHCCRLTLVQWHWALVCQQSGTPLLCYDGLVTCETAVAVIRKMVVGCTGLVAIRNIDSSYIDLDWCGCAWHWLAALLQLIHTWGWDVVKPFGFTTPQPLPPLGAETVAI